MFSYFYTLDYNPSPSSAAQPVPSANEPAPSQTFPGSAALPRPPQRLLAHARVYALAERYGIAGLKGLAVQKFKSLLGVTLEVEDFIAATDEVYKFTPESDRRLKDLIVHTIFVQRWLMCREDVQAMMKRLGELAYDVLMHTYGRC